MTTSKALILVDIQNDYFESGLWPVDDMDLVASTACKVLEQARADGDLVLHVYHEATSDTAPFFRPDTYGAKIHNSVAPLPDEATILKHRPNSFHETNLLEHLTAAGITDVTIIGAMTQMCIDATSRAARDFGFNVTLIADACGAKAQSFGDVHLSAQQVQAAILGPLEMSYARII